MKNSIVVITICLQIHGCLMAGDPRSLILVATGYGESKRQWGNEKDLVQVVDLNSNTLCSNLQRFPSKVYKATGGVLNNIPIICGGYDNNYIQQNLCFAYEKSSQSWLLHAKMNDRKLGASTAVINGALWVSGGYSRGTNKRVGWNNSVGGTILAILINV